MKKSSRIGILGIVIVLALVVSMVVLMETIGQNSAETARRIGEVFGGAAGALGAFFLAWWFLQRRSGE
jgi:hypothetical protein